MNIPQTLKFGNYTLQRISCVICPIIYTPDKRGHNFGNKTAGDPLPNCPTPLSTRTTGIPKIRYSITMHTRKAAPPFNSHSTGNMQIPYEPATQKHQPLTFCGLHPRKEEELTLLSLPQPLQLRNYHNIFMFLHATNTQT
jgi:hypothetical protein